MIQVVPYEIQCSKITANSRKKIPRLLSDFFGQNNRFLKIVSKFKAYYGDVNKSFTDWKCLLL